MSSNSSRVEPTSQQTSTSSNNSASHRQSNPFLQRPSTEGSSGVKDVRLPDRLYQCKGSKEGTKRHHSQRQISNSSPQKQPSNSTTQKQRSSSVSLEGNTESSAINIDDSDDQTEQNIDSEDEPYDNCDVDYQPYSKSKPPGKQRSRPPSRTDSTSKHGRGKAGMKSDSDTSQCLIPVDAFYEKIKPPQLNYTLYAYEFQYFRFCSILVFL